jgi:hypothetical protein
VSSADQPATAGSRDRGLGDRNWWLPRWLDRLLPNIDIEGRPRVMRDDGDELTPDVLVGHE